MVRLSTLNVAPFVDFFNGNLSNLWRSWALAIIAFNFFTYAPVMNGLFHSAPISGEAWLRIIIRRCECFRRR
jgi:hypothetical protein